MKTKANHRVTLAKREGDYVYGSLFIGIVPYACRWDVRTGYLDQFTKDGSGRDSPFRTTDWAIDPKELQMYVDWTKPIQASGFHKPRKLRVLSREAKVEGFTESLVMLQPEGEGWDQPCFPLLRTQDNKGVPTPWGGNHGIAVEISNIQPECKTLLVRANNKGGIDLTGSANLRLEFEDDQLTAATVLR